MLANLQQLGYLDMTPIQAASLPPALPGKDLIAQAKTGSGKTAAFALALLANLNPRRFAVQALVLCPTRELADQVTQESAASRAPRTTSRCSRCAAARRCARRSRSLEHGAHIVVGTPGRIMRPPRARQPATSTRCNTLVLDEADRMLDMGFFDDIAGIVRRLPEASARRCCSRPPTRKASPSSAAQFLRDPIEVDGRGAARRRADRAALLRSRRRASACTRWRGCSTTSGRVSTLAFCNTKAHCRELVEVLRAQGFVALALHGDLEQRERDQVLVQFANRSCSVLVATDVAARGLDIAQLEAVINVDVTPDPEVHVHRIGRTGRAGADRPGAEPRAAWTRWAGSAASSSAGRASRNGIRWPSCTAAARRPLRPPMAHAAASRAAARRRSAPATCWAR